MAGSWSSKRRDGNLMRLEHDLPFADEVGNQERQQVGLHSWSRLERSELLACWSARCWIQMTLIDFIKLLGTTHKS